MGESAQWQEELRVSLKDYFERLLHERDLRWETRLQAMEKALGVYHNDMERRLGALNELRSEVIQDRGEFLRKDIHESREKDITAWRDEIARRIEEVGSRVVKLEANSLTAVNILTRNLQTWGVIIAVIGLAIVIITHLIRVTP